MRLAPALQSFLALPAAERRIGPFLLVEQLGRGGFAPVWLAREAYGATELRTAAVKLFPLGGDGGDAPVASLVAVRGRILEEARALCRVEHPNVVRFYALALDEARSVGGLAMEHVAGTSLDQRLAVRGRISVPETLAVGIAIASALAAAHHKGIVHRDVKPANVVEAAGAYKLIDFGIAAADALNVVSSGSPVGGTAPRREERVRFDDLAPEALGTRASTLLDMLPARKGETKASTIPGALACGTLGYIDPACLALNAPADATSDLYGLGATLFECLTGRVPAAKPTDAGVGLRGDVLDGRATAPPLLDMAPEAPAALCGLVDALLRPERQARPSSAEWVATVLEQVRAELAGLTQALPPESVGPFRGLGRFREGDRGVFFGRSSEIAAALEVLRGRGLLALVGPSGSGKSSLARAGVLPAIAEGALGGWPKAWDAVSTEPGHDPRAAIAAALAPLVPDAGAREPEALIEALAERARSAERGVVLLIDQLEGLTTLPACPSRDWTILLLHGLASPASPGVRLVVTARRDLLDPLLALEGLGKSLIRGSVLIEPIAELTWAAVLEQALAAYGYALEDEALREEIAAGIAQTGSAMPLVQFALTELWEKRDKVAKKVTRAGLHAIGGLSGALERHAEATLAELGEEVAGAEQAAKGVLLSLTTPQGTRAARTLEELLDAAGPDAREVVEAFEQARLLVVAADGVTLAHEALLSQWGRLRAWVQEAQLLGEELERDAARWRADPTLRPLWRERRLALGEWLVGQRFTRLSADAVAFLKAARQERRARLVGIGVSVVIAATFVGLVGLVGLVGVAYIRVLKAKWQTEAVEQTNSRALIDQRERGREKAQAIDRLLEELRAARTEEQRRAVEIRIREVALEERGR
jgi:eukaryotic-like serine/threonine-protein kinase